MAAFALAPALTQPGARSSAAFDFSGGTMPPGATLRRASAASRFDAAGVLVTAAVDTPRFDHDPASRRLRGLLIEGEATNLLLHSQALGEAAWSHNGGSPAPAGVPAPDGGTGATLLSDASTSNFVSMAQGVSHPAGLVASAFVRKDQVPAEARYPVLRMTPPLSDVRFDTMTGAASGVGGGAFGIADAGAYWRVWRAAPAGASSVTLFPAVGNGGLPGPYSGGATGSIVAWGMQAEVGTEPSSYIATGAVAATRAADRLTIDWGMRGVPDGPLAVRYRFDDGSYQAATMTVAGGKAEVPTTLARRHLMRIERA